jgi:hypothetical protein
LSAQRWLSAIVCVFPSLKRTPSTEIVKGKDGLSVGAHAPLARPSPPTINSVFAPARFLSARTVASQAQAGLADKASRSASALT